MKNKLLLFALAVALGLAAIGIHYRNRIAIAVVMIGLAVFCVVCGFHMIVTREAVIPTSGASSAHREYHTGTSAVIWGVLFLMFSVPVAAFGFGYWMYGDQPPASIVQLMVRSPLVSGLTAVLSGLGIGLYGLTRVLPGKEAFRETRIGPFERGFTAVYLSIVAAIVVAAGLVRMLMPGALTRLRDAALAWGMELVK